MDLPNTLLDLLQRAGEPQTAAQLARQLPVKTPAKAVAAALEELAAAGQAIVFTQGKGSAYATHAPADLCAEALTQRVALITEGTAPAKLKAALPKALRPWFDEALGRLIVQGAAFWLPKGKSRLVLPRPVRPSDVLPAAALGQLKKLLAIANRHRGEPRSLAGLLAWLDGDTAPAAAEPPPPVIAAQLTPELLRQWYQTDRARSSSAMIPIPHTWKRYESWASTMGMRADIVDFRQALETLYNSGSAMLEPCERPQDLPEDERHLQVPLSIGPPGYYWSPMV
jgi:hypothetical protein